MSVEVITTHDKDVRDRLFEDLRKNGNELERQVVKFSGNEKVTEELRMSRIYDPTKHKFRATKMRLVTPATYRSNWSVAYPQS